MIGRARDLRADSTHAERVLWDRLRAGRLNKLKFRRQHPVGRYVVDLYCAAARLVVELDGASHTDREDEDKYREESLRSQGLKILRFTNDDVLWHLDATLDTIARAASS